MATGLSIVKVLNNRYREDEGKKRELVTRDFLDVMSSRGGDHTLMQRHACDLHCPPLYMQQKPPNLELNLYLNSSYSSAPPHHPPAVASCRYDTTICTLDRDKSAQEPFDGGRKMKKNQSKILTVTKDEQMVAVGCPRCLLYVLVLQSCPRCPRCESPVPLLPETRKKKARVDVDLNSALF